MSRAPERLRDMRRRTRLWAFDQRALAWRPRLIAIGDSNANAILLASAFPGLRATVNACVVPGATAQGLRNPNSRTVALQKFQERCDRARSWQTLSFLLGEVDCGFVIWYRAEKYGVSIESQTKRSLDAYLDLLSPQVQRGLRTLALSVPLPTIRDDQDWGDVANARREIKASQRDRTELTLEYNARLSSECSRIGARFVDVTTPTLDPATGVIRDEYLNPIPTNHHLHFRKYAELIGPAITLALRDRGDDPPIDVDHPR